MLFVSNHNWVDVPSEFNSFVDCRLKTSFVFRELSIGCINLKDRSAYQLGGVVHKASHSDISPLQFTLRRDDKLLAALFFARRPL